MVTNNPAFKQSKKSLVWAYFREMAEKQASCDHCRIKVSTAGNNQHDKGILIHN